ncbi:hypothetical protein FOA52_000136 [Chlamydomonas sp. UWO 241]|nr:hypothetical protein FOA52_000136 [Chlamydomonas sp. UWO 241]
MDDTGGDHGDLVAWRLIHEHGIQLSPQEHNALHSSSSRSLADCFKLFSVIHRVTTTHGAVSQIAAEVVADAAADGVLYMELRTTPKVCLELGMSKRSYVSAVLEGLGQHTQLLAAGELGAGGEAQQQEQGRHMQLLAAGALEASEHTQQQQQQQQRRQEQQGQQEQGQQEQGQEQGQQQQLPQLSTSGGACGGGPTSGSDACMTPAPSTSTARTGEGDPTDPTGACGPSPAPQPQPLPLVKLLLSIDRREGAASAAETVELAAEFPGAVVGIDLSGDPTVGEWREWAGALARACELGLRITLHCGEVPNDAEFASMLAFGPNRLGHCCCLGAPGSVLYAQAQAQQIASLVDVVSLLVSRVPGAPMQMPHAEPARARAGHAAHSAAPRAAPAAEAAQPARPAAAAAPVASAGGGPATERPASGATRAASARGPSRRGGLPARVGDTSLRRSFVLSIPVARGANWFLAGGGRRMDEEEATAAAAERIAAAAEDGTSLPVRLATDVVRFLYGGTGRREPADGGVVSASLLNAKPAVGGIGVEPRGGGVLRVLFTVASDAVADTVVRWRHELRRCVDSTAVFDVLSDREEAQHQALWPAFLAAKVAGKRAQFHRARLVVDGERLLASRIPVELCLTSNVLTGGAASVANHHFGELRAAGASVALCTDDSGVFGTSLSEEFATCARSFRLGRADLAALCVSAVDYTFCSARECAWLARAARDAVRGLGITQHS